MNMSWKRGACALTIAAILTGCSSAEASKTLQPMSDTDSDSAAQVQEPDGAEALESGTVSLNVWAEENDFEMLEAMIASFQEYYAGQANFEISLTAQPDSGTWYWAISTAPETYSPSPTISLQD